jgi:hypothetical protein
MCGEQKSYTFFIYEYRGYDVRDFRVCCDECARSFNKLPTYEALPYIRAACLRYYGDTHYIYTLKESDTGEVRYVGRTKEHKTRYKQHRNSAYEHTHAEALERHRARIQAMGGTTLPSPAPQYTHGFWLHDIEARGAVPVMDVVETVADGPLGVEREMRWMCHLLQKGYRLVNGIEHAAQFIAALRDNPHRDFLNESLSYKQLDWIANHISKGAHHAVFLRLYYLGEIFSNPALARKEG